MQPCVQHHPTRNISGTPFRAVGTDECACLSCALSITPEGTMAPSGTSTAIEDEIITLETAYWDAIKADDLDSTLALTFDPCIVTGPQGAATFDHAAMTKMNEEKTWALKEYTIDNMNVQSVADDVAVLGYTIKLDMDVDGKPLS